MRIEKWSMVLNGIDDPYLAPELIKSSLMGDVYDHPTRKDGSGIITSSIEEIKNGIVYTRSGSEYELGEVHPAYLAEYPNALNILNE